MEKVSTLTISPEYEALLRKVRPKVIRTEKENEAYTEILYDLDRRSARLTAAEKELAELLKAAGCFAVLDGAAPFAAERPSGCVRNTKYRVGSFEWQTRIEQGTDWTIERALPRIARTFLLSSGLSRGTLAESNAAWPLPPTNLHKYQNKRVTKFAFRK